VRKPKEYGRSPVLLRKTTADLGQDATCRLIYPTSLSNRSHTLLGNWVISAELQVRLVMQHGLQVGLIIHFVPYSVTEKRILNSVTHITLNSRNEKLLACTTTRQASTQRITSYFALKNNGILPANGCTPLSLHVGDTRAVHPLAFLGQTRRCQVQANRSSHSHGNFLYTNTETAFYVWHIYFSDKHLQYRHAFYTVKMQTSN
jgi:hypothetical protein